MIRSNENMKRLIRTMEDVDKLGKSFNVTQIMGDQPCFVESQGCVFMHGFSHNAERHVVGDFHDRTGFECFINHVHLSDFVEIEGIHRLWVGFQYVAVLSEELKKEFPERRFTIIISYGPDTAGDCVVRFHCTRENEQWLSDDLEGYETEAVQEIRI